MLSRLNQRRLLTCRCLPSSMVSMRNHLLLLPRPSHYLGTEYNSVHKNLADVRVRAALAFPDLYEVGMSYLGGRILYHHVNAHPRIWAERVFAPPMEAAMQMQAADVTLTTLESGTPLRSMDMVAFSLTHELCYTNVLYMLDLAGIARRSEQRPTNSPIIVAGGGAAFNLEPLAPFLDIIAVGDGEDLLLELLLLTEHRTSKGWSKAELLHAAGRVTGCYVPGHCRPGLDKRLRTVHGVPVRVEKRVFPDLENTLFPTDQVVPFGQVIHDRLCIEIARGCTRGCRFCQAGMIYRPVRERSVAELHKIIRHGLERTGFDEISFLSLSAGDYSDLEGLFALCFRHCSERQVSVSLPSLRVGSVGGDILDRIASIRRTGITLAPEAGSQRLRNVINKNITEADLLAHTRAIFERGWSAVKLYFMIGLPTETEADLEAILDLCLKVKKTAADKTKRLQVTASISPFVPKPHTPFQWERQISLEEMRQRIDRLKTLFRPHRRLNLRWHMPEMSWLEGVFARGDRELAAVVEKACDKGALFSSWSDTQDLHLWLESMKECGIDPEAYLSARNVDEVLPWEHICSGVRKEFLVLERTRALAGCVTLDCRGGACQGCGVCTGVDGATTLKEQADLEIRPRIWPKTSHSTLQLETGAHADSASEKLSRKGAAYKLGYCKLGTAVCFSQLELAKLFERAMRRVDIPMSFSKGFHPMPRISFGRALPVGVGSVRENAVVVLREAMDPEMIRKGLAGQMPRGLKVIEVQLVAPGDRPTQAMFEEYVLLYSGDHDMLSKLRAAWDAFEGVEELAYVKKTKRGERLLNLRGLVRWMRWQASSRLHIVFDFRENYLNPLVAVQVIAPGPGPDRVRLTKIRGHEDFQNTF